MSDKPSAVPSSVPDDLARTRRGEAKRYVLSRWSQRNRAERLTLESAFLAGHKRGAASRRPLVEAAQWFMERAEEWVRDPEGKPFDPRHITHAAAQFERALLSSSEESSRGH